MQLSIWCFTIVFAVHSPTTADDDGSYACGTSLLYHEEQTNFDPSRYIADDPKDFKPFKIHFVMTGTMTEENQEGIEEMATYINQRLSSVIKARPMEDVRIERQWNGRTGNCSAPMCGEVEIPGEYAYPCIDPATGEFVKELGVPENSTAKIAELNFKQDVTLVVFVEVSNCSDRPKQCDHSHWKAALTWGYAHSCQRDKHSNRPTHGFVVICRYDKKWMKTKTTAMFFHQVLHIVLSDSIVGYGSPHLNCTPKMDGEWTPIQCENVTYKAIERDWLEANGTRTKRIEYLVTTENVKRAAQEYFRCPGLEGAETEAPMISWSNDSCNSTMPIGSSSLVHWSAHLLPGEIMNPYLMPSAGRLSALTLGLLKDLGWYEVDMNASEIMEVTRPTEYGCDIAQKSCHENIQRARKEKRSDIIALPNTGPYCDNDYSSEDRIVTLQCVNDMEPLTCDSLTRNIHPPVLPSSIPDCGNILRSWLYEEYACEDNPTTATPTGFGGRTGPGTICVSIGPIPVHTFSNVTTSIGLCVNHTCDLVQEHLRLILYVSSGLCEIDCPADMSNKQKVVSFNGSEHCKKELGDQLQIICPNYTNVCVQLPQRSSTGSTQSTGPSTHSAGTSQQPSGTSEGLSATPQGTSGTYQSTPGSTEISPGGSSQSSLEGSSQGSPETTQISPETIQGSPETTRSSPGSSQSPISAVTTRSSPETTKTSKGTSHSSPETSTRSTPSSLVSEKTASSSWQTSSAADPVSPPSTPQPQVGGQHTSSKSPKISLNDQAHNIALATMITAFIMI